MVDFSVMSQIDLLVIGAGLAGLSAALAAAEAGQSVRVIAKGLGSLHWTAGTIDVLGYLPGCDEPVRQPFTAFTQLAGHHPYQLVGVEASAQAIEWVQRALAEQGLTYVAHGEQHNLSLSSPVGAPRPVYLAPQAQVAGDLSLDAAMLIVGFTGMRDFYPRLIAENLARQGIPVRSAFLPLSVITNRRDSNNIHLAAGLDNPETQSRLAAALKPLVQPGERIGLPAILGLEQHAQALARLQSALVAPVFEIPTLPPSVPGMRLFQALRRALTGKGVRVEANMEAIGFQGNGTRVEWVESATSARPFKHRAQRFLLATGGVLGGGFNSDHTGRFWETVFHLPLTTPQDRRQWFRPLFLDPQGQPVFHSGVAVNGSFQPVDGAGQAVYEKLWAAGGSLAHADPIAERSLEGLAIATGVAAAQAMR